MKQPSRQPDMFGRRPRRAQLDASEPLKPGDIVGLDGTGKIRLARFQQVTIGTVVQLVDDDPCAVVVDLFDNVFITNDKDTCFIIDDFITNK